MKKNTALIVLSLALLLAFWNPAESQTGARDIEYAIILSKGLAPTMDFKERMKVKDAILDSKWKTISGNTERAKTYVAIRQILPKEKRETIVAFTKRACEAAANVLDVPSFGQEMAFVYLLDKKLDATKAANFAFEFRHATGYGRFLRDEYNFVRDYLLYEPEEKWRMGLGILVKLYVNHHTVEKGLKFLEETSKGKK